MSVEPTPRRRRLGAELRRVRESLGWTQEEAARALGYKALSTVSKIESGTQGIKIQQLSHFFEVFGITDDATREHWRELVRKAGEPDWWQRYEDVVYDQLGDYLSDVEQANSIFFWNPAVLPPYLQTDDYERAVIEGSRGWTSAVDIDRFVAARREQRDKVLSRKPPLKIWAVLPEGLLRQQVGSRAIAHAQIEHLIEVARGDANITLQVLPFTAGAHAGVDGPFTLLSFPTGHNMVVLEAIRVTLRLTEAGTVEAHRTAADHLKSDALSRKASVAMLTTIAEDLAP
jgi:transcriptional regulator with XRE-family HTH domain